MAKIKQYRFYKNGAPSGKNEPEFYTNKNGETVRVTTDDYSSGAVFGDNFPITQLGVQALPGTKIYINQGSSISDGIIIGNTGIFELDLDGQTEITSLTVDAGSLSIINNNENAYLIIDTIYDKGE